MYSVRKSVLDLSTIFLKHSCLCLDLKELELGIIVDGEVVKAAICVYCGDNLECHLVGKYIFFNISQYAVVPSSVPAQL